MISRGIKIFIVSLLIFLPQLTLANCAWQLNDQPSISDDKFCSNSGEYLGKTGFGASTPDCAESDKPNAMYQKPVCCCVPDSSMVKLGNGQTDKTTPIYNPLDNLQIKIPGLDKLNQIDKAECTTTSGQTTCSLPWIAVYIKGIYNYSMTIIGILAAIALMIGGVIWIVSAGNATRITEAKSWIGGALTGLMIMFTSYILLNEINPNLVGLKPIKLGIVEKQELLAEVHSNGQASDYKNAACATDEELKNGVDFYATGYYKPKWEDSDNFRCVVAMQCSCPNGRDTASNCDFLYGKTYPDYKPCLKFDATTAYCDRTSSGSSPKIGDIAGPSDCRNNLPLGSQVCFKGKTYTITDSGGGIKGRRIDVWSGDDLDIALSVTGVGKLTKGPCN